jgi:hypothetical protein
LDTGQQKKFLEFTPGGVEMGMKLTTIGTVNEANRFEMRAVDFATLLVRRRAKMRWLRH